MISIYTVKWGTKYNVDHVNKILEQCREHITTDFDFYCLTEHTIGLHSDVIVIPFPEDNYYEKWWNKLYLFDKQVVSQRGEKLFLDLDIVIQNNIDCIVDHDPEDGLTFVRTHWHNMKKMKRDTQDIPRAYWVYSYNYGYMWPIDTREQIIRTEPLICLYDSMERPQDVKL